MDNNNYKMITEYKLTTADKMYLIGCSGLLVYILFKTSIK